MSQEIVMPRHEVSRDFKSIRSSTKISNSKPDIGSVRCSTMRLGIESSDMPAAKDGPTVSVSPWRPLRLRRFRSLLIADLVSDIGAFMQSVGAA
jgi:hypothetical protein